MFGTLFGVKKGSVRRVADTTAELADGESGVESVSYKPKTSNSSDIPYVPLPMFWASEPRFLALCGLRSVEICRKLSIVSKYVENSRNLLKISSC